MYLCTFVWTTTSDDDTKCGERDIMEVGDTLGGEKKRPIESKSCGVC